MTHLTIAVNGARLAYSVQGSGPLLFLVGAPVGMQGFAGLATRLANDFTVVTHDPRGIGKSDVPGTKQVTPQMLADDLFALIQTLSSDRVYIFGGSGGAVTGLDLLTRYPDAVHLLVAHEPPLFTLLPNAHQVLARADVAFQLAANDPDAGTQAFADLTETLHATYALWPRPEQIMLPPAPPSEREKNRFFLSRMAPGTVHYQPLFAQILPARLHIAAGEASIGQPARQAAEALAQIMRIPLIDAPGNHLGMLELDRFAPWVRAQFALS